MIKRMIAKLTYFYISRFWNWIVCQIIAYDEALITTNFQVEPIIGLRNMRGQSS